MKRKEILIAFFALSFIFLYSTCSVEELPPAAYPRVNTLEVSDISPAGVTLNAEILSPGSDDVTEYGFVLGSNTNPNLSNSEIITLNQGINSGRFSATINYPLESGEEYYVRAYAKNSTYLTYGVNVVFTSLGGQPPLISDFTPKTGNWGDTLTIAGRNFSYLETHVKVNMDGVKSRVLKRTDTTVVCLVPNGVVSASFPIEVIIRNSSTVSSGKFSLTIPEIDSFYPKVGTFGDTLTILGDYFSEKKEQNEVYLDEKSCEIIRATRDSIKVKVPFTIDSQFNKIEVTRASQTGSAQDLFQMLAPSVENYTTPIYSGEIIEILGEGFNPDASGNLLMFDEYIAEIVEASRNKLRILVPEETFSRRIIDFELMAAGQKFSTEIQISNPWIRKNDIPGTNRYKGVMFGMDDHCYVGLGEDYSNRIYLNDFHRFDPVDESWETITDYPGEGRTLAVGFVLDDKAYVGGGKTRDGYDNSFYRYDPSTNDWTAVADFPLTQLEGAGIEANGKGYVYAGYERLWSYDPIDDSWIEHPVQELLYFPTTDISLFVVDQTLYVCRIASNQVFMVEFDLEREEWTRTSEYSLEEYAGNGKAFTIDDEVIVLAGSSLYKFDPKRRELTRFRDFERINTSYQRAAELNGKGYYGGGVDSKLFFEYSPEFDKEFED